MLVMKIVHNDEIDLVHELQELREILKKKNITIGLVESGEGSSHLIKVMCNEECYNEKIKRMIYLYISNILYNIVIEKYREKELFNFLTETYFFLKQEEILEVEEMIMKVLRSEENLKDEKMIFCISKINSIIEKIKTCLEENEEINIKGFITFRMKELREDIEEIIDKVVEEYMVEKEYKEFVKLLKYFVDIQESKIEKINIYIHEGGGYELKDGYGNDIFNEFMKELSECKIDTEAKIEDIIISGLITNAPKQVIIHHKENCLNAEFIETIVNVFGDRVFYCTGCTNCKTSKLKV
ncbi:MULTISPECIES: putative sporulation protein YtxC [Clostridium]|uniref:putative sporulation protein YtxC n=1 Tax=Clostridium TaxID=1485 RepID=UPI0004BCCE0A|nr:MULTISPECIES: putative sporulation protein YtxC [Clostridium]MBX9184790.1 putative sporulation protein YtxC [Clostridium sp. K04]MDU3522358.1 putative sporulation protein YtxC [Clostridium saudiense]MDU7454752.1 putative sporulation protein YtxC [Clostridium saudiense]CUN34397.1 sporulation protein YtxC [Clostridium disporicum]SCJ15388.1 putative sporulation protein YtxC [uncultured Clostridium sp.]